MAGVDGLISGMDTTAMVDAMIGAERIPVVLNENKRTMFGLKLEAIQSFNRKLLSAQLDTSVLKRDETFLKHSASVSSESVLDATPGISAVNGTYNLNITSTAKSHQIATAGESSNTSTIATSGNITLKIGGLEKNIDVSGLSLNEISTAINDADLGITASVVNDGDASNPYRLVMKSNETGTVNAIEVSGAGDAAIVNLFDQTGTMTELTTANDATIELGSTNPIVITSSSNTVDDVIPGVTLNIKNTGSTSITIESNSEFAKEQISTFVESLNTAIDYFNTNSSYTGTGEAGILFSESGMKQELNSAISMMTRQIDGLSQNANSLSSIGIKLSSNGKNFEIDDEILDDKLLNYHEDVKNFFTNTGSTSNAGVQFFYLNNKTNTDNPFTVNITTAAEQANTASLGDLAVSTVINSSNKNLDVKINDTDYAITLSEGTYTREEMVAQVQDSINSLTSAGDELNISLNGNALSIKSKEYGAAQTIEFSASNAQAILNISSASTSGVDVAGTINGDAVTGNGQALSGKSGTDSEGLILKITASAPVSGVTLTAIKGFAQEIHESLTNMTDSDDGTITAKETSYGDQIDNLTTSIDEADALLEMRRARYMSEFQQLEVLMQQFKTQESALKGQITGFENLAKGR